MREKKKIVNTILMFIVMCSFVAGNIDVDIDIDTEGGDAEISVNPNTGNGDTTYILDGVDYKDSVNDLSTRINGKHQLDLKTVWYKLSEIFIEWDYEKDMWVYRDPSELTSAELRLKQGFDLYFATEMELRHTQQDLSQLQLEVLAIQKLFSEKDLCNGRLLVSQELNIKTVSCGNTVYTNNGNEFIGIELIENKINHPPTFVEKKEIKPLTPNQKTLDRYKEMCDRGVPKFCKVLSEYEYLLEPFGSDKNITKEE